jgi:hypothetical protein
VHKKKGQKIYKIKMRTSRMKARERAFFLAGLFIRPTTMPENGEVRRGIEFLVFLILFLGIKLKSKIFYIFELFF